MPSPDRVVSTEQLPGSQVGVSVEVPQAEVDKAFDRVLQRLQQRVKIEGFRPGKAPRELVEARVGSAALREEAIDLLVPEVVTEVLRDQAIAAIDRPRVDIQEFERGRPARFSAKVSVYPDVKLPDLASLKVDVPSQEVTEEMVDRRIEELRDRLAEITPVDRPARPGDIVVADIDVTVDGKEIPGEQRRAIEAEVKEGVLIPELLAVVPGRSAGEVAETDITLAEDHVEEDLRSKPAHIRFTVQGVKEKVLPPLDDELAKQLSEGKQETLAALRDAVRDDLDEAAQRLGELAFEQAVVKEVVDRSEIEIPQALVDHEVAHRLQNLEERLQQQGLRLDRYLGYLQKTPEQWIEEERPEAEGRIKVDLVLESAGKQLGVEPTNEQVMEYMREQVAQDEELKDRYLELVANPNIRDFYEHRLRRLQTLERLVEKAGGKPVPSRSDAGEKTPVQATEGAE
jgi:trigger factor